MHLFELVIAMLLAIIVLHFIARKLNLPPAVALLAGGTLLAFIPGLPQIHLDPALVLVIFLPPLLMDGAWFIPFAQLRKHILGVGSLAIGAVIFTTVVVAVVTHWLFPALPWAACAALGAIVAPPDAVSARAVLQQVHLPKRPAILLEGESLLNDATGLVLFRFAVAAGVTGAFSAVEAVQSFAILAIGGAVVGAVIAGIWVKLAKHLKDEYLIIAASCLTAWASYLAGEMLHVSGVIACVVAGLICGWYQHVVFSAAVRMRGTSFWTVMIFLMEAMVFMLIGSSLRGVLERVGGFGVIVEQMAVPILLILLALTLARFAWVFGGDLIAAGLNRMGWKTCTPLGAKCSTVISWAGMRGVVTLAVALSVPENFPGRDFMLVTAFAVILGTVVIQGMTLGQVIRWADLKEHEADRARMTMSQAEASMAQAQAVVVQKLAYDEDGKLVHPQLLERYSKRAVISVEYAADKESFTPRLHAHFDLILAAVAAGRAELIRLHRAGEIDDHTLHELERDLDLEELSAISAKA
ncbi:sodium:proton antiporter [Asticcacaulis sp. AC460]|uniref:Na+/H+ antiporter n=1 Tax=Asticcacaulis sp. AC460 TaxID=1282360 RepID=UPI0003C3B555|nr:Na+/H+ antiporter [Asticcacaulis sp. AC460]ESQ88486.1 sodium:proton antiporter [Asticcacaulis sp. AC460]